MTNQKTNQMTNQKLQSVSKFFLAGLSLVAVAAAPGAARADVVVNGTQQPSPPQPVVVQPPQPAPVVAQPQAPVAAPVPRHTTVIEHEPHNYMSTIAWSAIAGGVAGVLVGGAIYYLVDDRTHADRIFYWGAGGVLVGSAVGIMQVVSEENRLDRATASRLPVDPVPTYRLALYRVRF
jgi:hypothetical protein